MYSLHYSSPTPSPLVLLASWPCHQVCHRRVVCAALVVAESGGGTRAMGLLIAIEERIYYSPFAGPTALCWHSQTGWRADGRRRRRRRSSIHLDGRRVPELVGRPDFTIAVHLSASFKKALLIIKRHRRDHGEENVCGSRVSGHVYIYIIYVCSRVVYIVVYICGEERNDRGLGGERGNQQIFEIGRCCCHCRRPASINQRRPKYQ